MAEAVTCSKCGTALDGKADWAAAISGSISGDECTEVYLLCKQCGFYTVAIYWDNFTGVESSSRRGPVAEPEAAQQIALIRQCTEPWDKKCRCAAHLAHFEGMLD